jgi:CubicO group peptidase (beta-lactamase class C family)
VATEQILKVTAKQKELNFETGTAFGYSNTDYIRAVTND